jgi:hypothetical protein
VKRAIQEQSVDKHRLLAIMLDLLQSTLDGQNEGRAVAATPLLPLVGENAAITSMNLVSFIADVETTLESTFDVALTLVSEKALSRQKSPFRNVETLAEYVLELVGVLSEPAPVG